MVLVLRGVPPRLNERVCLQVCVCSCLAQHSGKEADGLHSLAQAHVIGQDATLVLGILPEEEPDAVPLVAAQEPVDTGRNLQLNGLTPCKAWTCCSHICSVQHTYAMDAVMSSVSYRHHDFLHMAMYLCGAKSRRET